MFLVILLTCFVRTVMCNKRHNTLPIQLVYWNHKHLCSIQAASYLLLLPPDCRIAVDISGSNIRYILENKETFQTCSNVFVFDDLMSCHLRDRVIYFADKYPKVKIGRAKIIQLSLPSWWLVDKLHQSITVLTFLPRSASYMRQWNGSSSV